MILAHFNDSERIYQKQEVAANISSSHLERTSLVPDRPQHPVCGVRGLKFSRQISHHRCSIGVLVPAARFRTAASLSSWLSALADSLCWRGFQSFPGLTDADAQKPPMWPSCAPPLGSGHTQCFPKRSPVPPKHKQIHLEPRFEKTWVTNDETFHRFRLAFFSKSTECTEAAAPAPTLTPSSGALYRPRPESSCHSPGPGVSACVRVIDSTMGSSRRKCSMVLLCSWSLSFPFSICQTKKQNRTY